MDNENFLELVKTYQQYGITCAEAAKSICQLCSALDEIIENPNQKTDLEIFGGIGNQSLISLGEKHINTPYYSEDHIKEEKLYFNIK